eukprot:TRINITY_DN8793_c0_g4_i1.p1 TRINITY_DN8793_c0_g4~~TRINITY_DN8793_c0_g4_i1.p1  ORF type:complete len:1087 (+),score=223.15 TRINITY_DN8793_c0_g4_i1:44-3304(+)
MSAERLLEELPNHLQVSLRASATEALDAQHNIAAQYLSAMQYLGSNPPLTTIKPFLSSLQKLVTNLKWVGSLDDSDVTYEMQQTALEEAQAIISLATDQITILKSLTARPTRGEAIFHASLEESHEITKLIVERINIILGIEAPVVIVKLPSEPSPRRPSFARFRAESIGIPSPTDSTGSRGRSFSVHRGRTVSTPETPTTPRMLQSLDEILQQYVAGGDDELPDDLYIPSGHEEVSLLDMILDSQSGNADDAEGSMSKMFDDILSLYETTQASIEEARATQTESSAKLDSLVDMLSSLSSKKQQKFMYSDSESDSDSGSDSSGDESDSPSKVFGSKAAGASMSSRRKQSSSNQDIISMAFGGDIGGVVSSDYGDHGSKRNKWVRAYGEEPSEPLGTSHDSTSRLTEESGRGSDTHTVIGDEFSLDLLVPRNLPPPSREEGDEVIDYSRYVGEHIPLPPPPPPSDFFDDMDSFQEPETDGLDIEEVEEDIDGYEGLVKIYAKKVQDKAIRLVDDATNIKKRQKVASSIQQTKIALKDFVRYANDAIAATTDSLFLIRLHAVCLDIRAAAVQLLCSVVAANNCEDNSLQMQLKSIIDVIADRIEVLNKLFKDHEEKMAALEAKADSAIVDTAGEEDVSIWNDKPESKDNIVFAEEADDGSGPSVNSATLNKLIERVTHERFSDNSMMKTFFITYQSFTTPHTVIRKFKERFNVPQRRLPKNIMMSDWQKIYVGPIQMRVGSCLKYWIENRFEDFDSHMLAEVHSLLETMSLDDANRVLATQIRNLIDRQIKAREAAARGEKSTERSFHSLNYDLKLRDIVEEQMPAEGLLHSQVFSVYPVSLIAQLMTEVDFRLFAAIQPSELLNQSWNKPKLRYRAPNVLAFIARFNQISAWVASIILWEENIRKRKKKMTKIVELNLELRKLKNYNAVAAVCAGLCNSAVHRLKFTREILRKGVVEIQEELENLMSPEGSYKNYREDIHTVNPPCVPFLGVYLRDLVFIEDGNPDTVGDNLINFQKRRFVYNVIQEICQYQQTAYRFEPVEPLMSYCMALPALKDDDLYKLSLSREGRNATREEVFKTEKSPATQ